MPAVTQLHNLILTRALLSPAAAALSYRGAHQDYAALAADTERAAARLLQTGLLGGQRVAVYLDKCLETVHALFGTSFAGGVAVPVNPLLKAEQVAYILQDCNVRILVTSADRFALLREDLAQCPDLHTVFLVGGNAETAQTHFRLLNWGETADAPPVQPHRGIDADMAAILYTSGSTGRPKGVVLSHRNMIAGAQSVAEYLENTSQDRILSVLPLSFDYGLSQLTTAFHSGASVVLLNYLMPRDVIRAVARENITGLAAVPPLWIQLAQLDWPEEAIRSLRYTTNSGGAMPRKTLDALRARLPQTRFFLMYGLTEAFRSTYLPPEEIDRRPDSMGKAIPNAEIMVVREDGTPCAADEPGELVHRGALVSLGYWNDPARTAERFRPAPGRESGIPLTEIAVWSGDTVRRDAEGFLYFIGRRDEMIKTSGYRVSPNEVEEVVYGTGLAAEAAAMGIPHPALGHAIVLVVTPKTANLTATALMDTLRPRLPAYMVPAHIEVREQTLPRNANGKIDRKALSGAFQQLFQESDAS